MCKKALWSTHIQNWLFHSFRSDQTQVTKYSESIIILSFPGLKGKKVFIMGDRKRIQLNFMIHFLIALV